MHAIHPDPLRALAAAVLALALTLAALALAPRLSDVDLHLSSGGHPSGAPAAVAAKAAAADQPRWVRDPIAPPSLTRP
jgi:hypothetical protein